MMNDQERHSAFSELITRHQSQLYAYIFALLRNREDAEDLLQSVYVVLWRKFDTFEPHSNFFQWARQAAVYELRNSLKHRRRPASVSPELLDALVSNATGPAGNAPDVYLAALRRCRAKLGEMDEQLLNLRYVEDISSREIAARMGRPQQGVCNSLMRIRRSLLDCVRRELAQQQHDQQQ